MAKFTKGQVVEQVLAPIRGEVTGYELDRESGEVLTAVSWVADDGEHVRYFKEAELALVE